MDFHTLSRKELQALCKKNKIPANMTNVAMANALADLQQVEGLDEFMNSVDSDAQKFPDEKGVGTPDIHRTACRTSTRRKPSVREEPESCKVSTRRRTRAGNDEGIDQENKDLNVPVTPAVPSSRTRAPAVTTRRKKEDEKPTERVHKTPAASRSRVRATSAYNTRRSVRLLEKNLTKMNLTEETGSDDISEGMTSFSQKIEDSAETGKGASSQTESTEDLEKTNEIEVTSSEKNTGYEYECQSNDSKSAVQSDLEMANDAGASSQTVSAEDLEKTNEIEVTSSVKNTGYKYECQTNDSKSAVQSDLEVANEAGASSQTVSAEDLEKINEMEVTSSEKNTGYECQLNDFKSEVQSDSEPVVANDAGDSLQADSQESPGEINESEAPSMNISSCYEGEPQDSNSKPSLSSEKCYDSDEVSEFCDESEVDLTKAIDKEMVAKNERGTEISCDSSEPDHTISPSAKNGVSSVEDDAFVEDTEDKQKEDEHSTMGNDYQNSELMNKAAESDVPQGAVEVDASVEVAEEKTIEMGDSAEIYATGGAVKDDAAVGVVEDKHEENAYSNEANDIQNSELTGAEKEAVKMDDLAEISFSGCSTGKQHEILEDNAYPPMVVHEELKESKEFVGKDASSENSVAVTQICIEPPMVVSEEAKAEAEPETTDFHTDKDIEQREEQAVTEESSDAIHPADQTLSTVTCAPICNEQQTNDDAVEVQKIRKISTQEENDQKENLINDDLHKKSMRKLKKMLKNLSLDGKINTESSTDTVNKVPVNKEVERKRTALQVLPENRMTASNGQSE